MKRYVIPFLLLVAGFPAHQVLAQEKPVLNSAPPGPPATPPRPVEPARAPEPAPAPEPNAVPAPQPTPNSPSGLDFPGRNTPPDGQSSDQLLTKKFLYSNFGLGFSSTGGISNFSGSIAPAIGYRITDKLAVGPGISYAYNNYSLSPEQFFNSYGYPYQTPNGNLTASGSNNMSSSSLGFKFFAQYIVYKEFFIHGEYEVTNAQLAGYDQQDYLVKLNRTVTSPLAGIGYRSYFNDQAAFDIVGLYNFDNTIFSLYPWLVVRASLLYNIGK